MEYSQSGHSHALSFRLVENNAVENDAIDLRCNIWLISAEIAQSNRRAMDLRSLFMVLGRHDVRVFQDLRCNKEVVIILDNILR